MSILEKPLQIRKSTENLQIRKLTNKETEDMLDFNIKSKTENAMFIKNLEQRFLKLLEPKEVVETIEDEASRSLEKRLENLKKPTDLKLEKRLKKLYSNEAELSKVEALLNIEENAFIATTEIVKNISSLKSIAKEDRYLILESINKVQNTINKDIERLDKRFDKLEDTNQKILNFLQSKEVNTQEQLTTFLQSGVKFGIKQLVLFPFTVLNFVLFAPAGRGFNRLTGPFRAIWDIIAFFILLFIFIILAIQLNHHFPSIYSAILKSMQLLLDASLSVIYKSYGLIEGEVPEALSIVKQTGKEYVISVKDYSIYNLQAFGNWTVQYIMYFMKIAICQGSSTSAYLMGINCSALSNGLEGSGKRQKSKSKQVSKKRRKTKSVKRKMKSLRHRK